jgi:protoheme IX farnesyltransferase
VTILPFAGGLFGSVYFIAAVLLGGGFIWLAARLFRRRDRRSALRLYLSSLAYLALLFAAMVVDVHV